MWKWQSLQESYLSLKPHSQVSESQCPPFSVSSPLTDSRLLRNVFNVLSKVSQTFRRVKVEGWSRTSNISRIGHFYRITDLKTEGIAIQVITFAPIIPLLLQQENMLSVPRRWKEYEVCGDMISHWWKADEQPWARECLVFLSPIPEVLWVSTRGCPKILEWKKLNNH